MTTLATPQQQSAGKLIVQDTSAVGYLMDTARFEHCYRIAKLMASASLIPEHLKLTGSGQNKRQLEPDQIAANCFMIVNQALRWGFDPFAVAPETYVVGGKLAYQGKLVMAAINSLAGLEERLSFAFTGKAGNPDFTITVSGRFKGESEARTVTVSVAQARTDNQMWTKDPEQKLVYTGSIKWARRHCPEVVMGIMLEDELDVGAMREASGRVVPDTNPYVETATAPEVADTQTAPPKPKRAAKPKPDPIPERTTMIAGIREAFRSAGITELKEAENRAQQNGAAPQGKRFNDLTDAEMHVLYQARETAFVRQEAAAPPASETVYNADDDTAGEDYPMGEDEGQ